jgi:tape measure domain-containing protein
MATTVDQLIVEIKADTKDLQRQLKNIEGRIGGAGNKGRTAFVPMIGSLKSMLPLLASVGAGIAGISAVSGIARVGSEFEDMRDSLNQVFGSVQRGNAAFNNILTFAQTTPFQIEDVTRAFISLKGAGIEPNMGMLQTFADTASTSIDQLGAFNAMVRLVQRSAAGGLGLEEINQLDDRGIPATKILTDALGVTRLELSKFGQTAEGAADMVQKLIAGMQEQFGGAMVNKMDNLSTKTSNMTIAFKELQNSVFEGGLGEFLGDIADKLGALATNAARTVRAITGNETAFDFTGTMDPSEQLDRLAKLTDDTQKRIESRIAEGKVRGGGSQQQQQDRELLKTLEFMTIDAEDALFDETLKQGLDDTKVKTTELSKAMGELDNVVKEAAQTLSREFADALLEGESLLSSFGNFAKSIVSEIIATFLRLAVVEPILKSIFPNLGTSTGTPTVEGAGGGLATHGRPMLVGERGPELFVPHAPGNIVNGADTRSALGGGGGVVVNQNISFATGVVPTVRAEVTKMLPQIADVSKAAVLDASLRGGSFSKGLRGRSG